MTIKPVSLLMMAAPVTLLSFTLSSTFVHAVSPSFDCTKADGSVEELICQDAELAALDQTLSEVYKTALDKAPKAELDNLKAFQRGWVKGRNDCWKAENIRDCVQFSYESRITELQIGYGEFMVPGPVSYHCDDNRLITAIFYQETPLPAAVLTRIPDQVIAFLSPTGSGSKYEGQNVSFWTKGDEAMVNWNGEALSCQTK